MSMTLIQTVTVGSGGQASIEFGAGGTIPTTFTDLVVVLSARTNRASNNSDIIIQFNGVTSATYSFRRLYGDGGSANSDSLTNNSLGGFIGNAAGNNATSNTFGNLEAYIPNYRSSAAKSFSGTSVSENNATSALQVITAGLWSGTDPITSIQIKDYNGSSFLQYTTASLFGVLKGSDGIVTVS